MIVLGVECPVVEPGLGHRTAEKAHALALDRTAHDTESDDDRRVVTEGLGFLDFQRREEHAVAVEQGVIPGVNQGKLDARCRAGGLDGPA